MKTCGLCEFKSADAQECAAHMQEAHSWNQVTAAKPPSRASIYGGLSAWGLVVTFGWIMMRDVEGFHLTPPADYVVQSVEVLGVLLAPAALLVGAIWPSGSWRWGIALTWPAVAWSAFSVASGCVIDTVTCKRFDPAPTLAGLEVPVLVVAMVCLAAWIAATVRSQWRHRAGS